MPRTGSVLQGGSHLTRLSGPGDPVLGLCSIKVAAPLAVGANSISLRGQRFGQRILYLPESKEGLPETTTKTKDRGS